jgi:hypothetical protein
VVSDLPSFDVAFRSLSKHGLHFPSYARELTELRGATYRDGQRRHHVIADTYALQGVGRVYADNAIRQAMARQLSLRPCALGDAARLLNDVYGNRGRLVLGFSGYGTAGHPYQVTADGMKMMLGHLRQLGEVPSLIVDGGVSDGVPGLSGLLAKRAGVASLGYIPKAGLAEFGPRTHLVVHGDLYPQREQLVGLTGDILTTWDGHDATGRECAAAAAAGCVIVIMALQDSYERGSFPLTYKKSREIRIAIKENRLKVCRRREDILATIRWAVRTAAEVSVPRRNARLRTLRTLLAE